MRAAFSRNQLLIMAAVPAIVALAGWAAHAAWGGAGLVVPVALGAGIVAALVIEGRMHAKRLSDAQIADARIMYNQIEAIIGLYHLLRPALPLPYTRSWAAAPDLLREVAMMILTEEVRLVVEAGSGTSTVVIAHCLKKAGRGRVIALEHDAAFAERTRKALRDHGLDQVASVLHAPLVRQQVEGREALWYDSALLPADARIDLLLVDGPPDTVQPMARYPAIPLLRNRLAPGARVLLDDGARPDEREAARRWKERIPGSDLRYVHVEGGAWLLRMP